MSQEPELIISTLSQSIVGGGHTFEVYIFQLEGETDWALEVEDEYGNSTVWDDAFPSDVAALAEAKAIIFSEKVSTLIGPEDLKDIDPEDLNDPSD